MLSQSLFILSSPNLRTTNLLLCCGDEDSGIEQFCKTKLGRAVATQSPKMLCCRLSALLPDQWILSCRFFKWGGGWRRETWMYCRDVTAFVFIFFNFTLTYALTSNSLPYNICIIYIYWKIRKTFPFFTLIQVSYTVLSGQNGMDQ